MTEELTAIDKDLSRLRSYATSLRDLADEILKTAKSDYGKDDMGYMAFLIVNRQLENLNSIIALNDQRQYRDTQLITRTMLEGLALIYWAFQERDKRPAQWLSCAWIEEFRRYYTEEDYLEYKSEIKSNLIMHCKPFLKRAAKDKPIDEITPDDYDRSCRWEEVSGVFKAVTIKKTFEDAGIGLLYDTYYALTSNWVHWNPIGIAEAIDIKSGVLKYGKENKYLGVIGYISGFKSLLQSTKFLVGYLNLKFEETLDKLEKDFDANCGPT